MVRLDTHYLSLERQCADKTAAEIAAYFAALNNWISVLESKMFGMNIGRNYSEFKTCWRLAGLASEACASRLPLRRPIQRLAARTLQLGLRGIEIILWISRDRQRGRGNRSPRTDAKIAGTLS